MSRNSPLKYTTVLAMAAGLVACDRSEPGTPPAPMAPAAPGVTETGAAQPPAPASEAERHDELKRLAAQAGAGHAVWLGENDAAAIRRVTPDAPCAAGEASRQAAIAAYSRSLDTLAGRIAEYPR